MVRKAAILMMLASTCWAQKLQPTNALTLPINVDQASSGWAFSAKDIEVVQDDVAHRPAFGLVVRGDPSARTPPVTVLSKVELEAPVALEAEVRLPVLAGSTMPNQGSRAIASLSWLQARPETGKYTRDTIEISLGQRRDVYSYEVDLFQDRRRIGHRTFTPAQTPADISPLMDESVRLVLERTADRLPISHERVHRLRLEVRPRSLQMFVNGRLAGTSWGDFSAGRVELKLGNQARLFSASSQPLQDVPNRFFPVPLDDLLTSKSPVRPPGLAEQPRRVATLSGVPFVSSSGAQGEDNVDLSRSVYLYRLGTARQGDPREAVREPEQMDTTRFTMRVPERTWRRAWVLAASDDDPKRAPVLTTRFYVPRTSWTVDAVATVPTYDAGVATDNAKRIPWTSAGKTKSLWLIPIELDAAALAVQPMSAFELTKAVRPYRSYPDPAFYASYPAGLPSAVHVYGVTLEEAPIWARTSGTKIGNLYIDGETPTWRVVLKNLTPKRLEADVDVTVTDPYGQSTRHRKRVPLESDGEKHEFSIQPPTRVFGLYTVKTNVRVGDFAQTREGTFLKLPPNHAKATPANSPWGLWDWNGGHVTNPDTEDNMRLLKALGAINSHRINSRLNPKEVPNRDYALRQKYGIGPSHYRLVGRELPEWSMKDPYDPAAYAAFAEEKGKEAREALAENPDLEYVNLFGENSISLRMTHGMSPWAMGRPWFDYDDKERRLVRAHWLTAKAALQGVRKYAPKLKVIFGHCAPNFFDPFFKLPEWQNDLFDGFGLDLPQFERMPERQPRATEPSLLYFLRHSMQEMKMTGKELVHIESYFPPSGHLALSLAEQADNIVRTAVLSLSLGTTKFLRTWALYTSGDGWGASHYGSPGLIDRAPEYNPKPAAAAFATMARVLDVAKYDGYVDTGSGSTFCVRFKDVDRFVYAAWTIHGTRPLQLTFDGTRQVETVDMQGNARPLEWSNDKQATLTLSSSPQWVVVRSGALASAIAGQPSYADSPRRSNRVIDPMDRDWTFEPNKHERYQDISWDMPREPGEMKHAFVDGPRPHSRVLRVELARPDPNKPMVGFYGLFKPSEPILLPGKPKALGAWVKGHSGWNRVLYELVDANGETWINCGTKDAWNSDDVASRSSVNHDGWRYMSFPLPATAPGDNYREADTTSWSSDGDQIVELPLKLKRIIVEMRPKMIYVSDMLPVRDLSLEFDELTAEYESARDQTDEPVKIQIAARNALVEAPPRPLPNPHDDLGKSGQGQAPTIEKVYPPDQDNNGRRLFLEVKPVTGARRYRGYVSAYPDGRGARALAVDEKSGHPLAASLKGHPNKLYFDGLRPELPMYLFVTTIDESGRESKPSAIRKVVLKDEFPFK
jgi:hypothetical protein